MTGTVRAVCVVHELRPNPWRPVGRTAIDKRPVEGRLRVETLGIDGDEQCDVTVHGGPHQAVYAYSDESADWWAGQLGREIEPGLFGENLRTSGLDVDGAEIGERWRFGEGDDAVLLEVASARTPCRTFAERMGEPHWIRRFGDRRLPGAYLRVLRAGTIGAGDPVTVEHRPGHGVTVAGTSQPMAPATAVLLLRAAEDLRLDLAPDLRTIAGRAAARV